MVTDGNLMANIVENAILLLAGNSNSGLSYLIATVHRGAQISLWGRNRFVEKNNTFLVLFAVRLLFRKISLIFQMYNPKYIFLLNIKLKKLKVAAVRRLISANPKVM